MNSCHKTNSPPLFQFKKPVFLCFSWSLRPQLWIQRAIDRCLYTDQTRPLAQGGYSQLVASWKQRITFPLWMGLTTFNYSQAVNVHPYGLGITWRNKSRHSVGERLQNYSKCKDLRHTVFIELKNKNQKHTPTHLVAFLLTDLRGTLKSYWL